MPKYISFFIKEFESYRRKIKIWYFFSSSNDVFNFYTENSILATAMATVIRLIIHDIHDLRNKFNHGNTI